MNNNKRDKTIIMAGSAIMIQLQDGEQIQIDVSKDSCPFELAKHLLFAHAENVGLLQCSYDACAYFNSLIDEKKTKH